MRVFLFTALIPIAASLLSIEDNRYDGLLIAIHKDVPEDRKILEEISSMVNDASGYLYQATRNRAFFGQVNILIPETWRHDTTWKKSSSETFEEAHIRVDKANPTQGNNPYTFQPRQCGEPGDYIHLTPEYVLDKDGRRFHTWGKPGRTLVHEFSHLRYGVFDEYGLGNQEHPNFYLDGENMLFPTACPKSIREGKYFEHGQEVEICEIDPETNIPGPNCTFVPDVETNSATASLMYDQAVAQIFTFCESRTSQHSRLHNSIAPNRHNKLCNGQGTWEIVSRHKDFARRNLPITVKDSTVKPRIAFLHNVQQRLFNGAVVCGRPVVLVLDLSGSMVGQNNRYFKQTQTADKLIRDILPSGTMLGIVTFSNNATKHQSMSWLSSQHARDRFARRLPKKNRYGGGTGIGNGLFKAKEMLVAARKEKEGRIVLITDGEENQTPFVANMKGNITKAGIKVHTIAYSAAAASSIRDLSEETGGQYAYYSESPESTALDSIMQTLLKDLSMCKGQNKIEIMREAKMINPPKQVQGEIDIDSTVGNDTMFVFTLPFETTIKVTLQDPVGRVYSSRSREYSIDSSLNIVRFTYPKAKNGTWNYTLNFLAKKKHILQKPGNPTGPFMMSPHRFPTIRDSVSVVVKALPTDTDPYEVNSWLSSMTVDPREKKPTIAYVHVHKGYSPVNSAGVTVTVERPGASPVKMKVKDDGSAPDNVASDGVYTAFFTKFSGNQRYSWDVDVKTNSDDGLVLATFPKLVQLSMARARYQNATPPVVVMKAEKFTRTSSPGAMDVSGYRMGKDYYAPSRVTDLTITKTDNKRRTVTLTWTAPGDDLDSGTATSYSLRCLRRFNNPRRDNDIRFMFEFGRKISSKDVVTGSLTPRIGGTKEIIIVKIPVSTNPVSLALRTTDDTRQTSDVSNVVTTTFKKATFAVNSSFVENTTPIRLPTSTSSIATSTSGQPETTSQTETTSTAANLLTSTANNAMHGHVVETTTSVGVTLTTVETTETGQDQISSNDRITKSKKYSTPINPIHTPAVTTRVPNVVRTQHNIQDTATVKQVSTEDNALRDKSPKLRWSLETIDKQAKITNSPLQSQTVVPQDIDQESGARMRGPDSVLIGIIVSGTIGLIIVVAVVAVVVSKMIITRVHASSDMSLAELQLVHPVLASEKRPKPPPSPLSITHLL